MTIGLQLVSDVLNEVTIFRSANTFSLNRLLNSFIEERLRHNIQFFDAIYALDGSTDKTADIIRSFDKVVYLIKDQDLYPKRIIRDGVRQFLLEKAQEDRPCEGWFTLLHGDEMLVDNPNEIAIRADKQGAEKLIGDLLNFFFASISKRKLF